MSNSPDYRQQEELEHERETVLLLVLSRVGQGEATMTDALYLSKELGLFDRFTQMTGAEE